MLRTPMRVFLSLSQGLPVRSAVGCCLYHGGHVVRSPWLWGLCHRRRRHPARPWRIGVFAWDPRRKSSTLYFPDRLATYTKQWTAKSSASLIRLHSRSTHMPVPASH
jgi:hypothetical protein